MGASRFGAEQLCDEVQDPLSKVRLVADPAQLQRALRHRLPFCKAQAQRSHPHRYRPQIREKKKKKIALFSPFY